MYLSILIIRPVDTSHYGAELKGIHKPVSVVTQMIIQNVKSSRQVRRNDNIEDTKNTSEPSLNIGFGKIRSLFIIISILCDHSTFQNSWHKF